MARKYANRRLDGSWAKPVGLTEHMRRADDALKAGAGPFQITQDGNALGDPLARKTAIDRYKKAVSNREIGSVFRVRNKKGNVVFTGRACETLSDADTTSGNEKCDVLWNAIKAEFGQYDPRYAGAYVCKYISGSLTRSQHSFGNALDIFFDTIEQQNKVAAWVVAHRDTFSPYHVITLNRIWVKGVGWHDDPGNDHYHLHVDFDPQYSGECGVKGPA